MLRLFKFWADRKYYQKIRHLQELRAKNAAIACVCADTMSMPADRLTGAPLDRVIIDRGPLFSPLEKSSIKKAREVLCKQS